MKLKFGLLLLFLFFSCENNEIDLTTKNHPENNKFETKAESIKAQPLPTDLTINGRYLIIGYFDENNNLEKVERFLNEKLLE